MAMALPVKNRFARIVECNIGCVEKKWPWLCCWWLPSTRGQEADIMVAIYNVIEEFEIGDR